MPLYHHLEQGSPKSVLENPDLEASTDAMPHLELYTAMPVRLAVYRYNRQKKSNFSKIWKENKNASFRLDVTCMPGHKNTLRVKSQYPQVRWTIGKYFVNFTFLELSLKWVVVGVQLKFKNPTRIEQCPCNIISGAHSIVCLGIRVLCAVPITDQIVAVVRAKKEKINKWKALEMEWKVDPKGRMTAKAQLLLIRKENKLPFLRIRGVHMA